MIIIYIRLISPNVNSLQILSKCTKFCLSKGHMFATNNNYLMTENDPPALCELY